MVKFDANIDAVSLRQSVQLQTNCSNSVSKRREWTQTYGLDQIIAFDRLDVGLYLANCPEYREAFFNDCS